jgi:hypothetical protein
VALAIALAALASAGCAGHDRVPVYPTQGKVLVDGKPAKQAMVYFHPLDPTDPKAPRPHARCEDDGTFKLSTYIGNDGAPAGKHAVTIDWRQKKSDRVEDEGVSLLPAKYNRPDASGLRAEVKEGPNELPPFELKTK